MIDIGENIREIRKLKGMTQKELLKRNGMTMTEASQLLGLSTPQQLNNKFNNKKVSLSDLKDFLGIMGYDYEIIIKKRSGSF